MIWIFWINLFGLSFSTWWGGRFSWFQTGHWVIIAGNGYENLLDRPFRIVSKTNKAQFWLFRSPPSLLLSNIGMSILSCLNVFGQYWQVFALKFLLQIYQESLLFPTMFTFAYLSSFLHLVWSIFAWLFSTFLDITLHHQINTQSIMHCQTLKALLDHIIYFMNWYDMILAQHSFHNRNTNSCFYSCSEVMWLFP